MSRTRAWLTMWEGVPGHMEGAPVLAGGASSFRD